MGLQLALLAVSIRGLGSESAAGFLTRPRCELLALKNLDTRISNELCTWLHNGLVIRERENILTKTGKVESRNVSPSPGLHQSQILRLRLMKPRRGRHVSRLYLSCMSFRSGCFEISFFLFQSYTRFDGPFVVATKSFTAEAYMKEMFIGGHSVVQAKVVTQALLQFVRASHGNDCDRRSLWKESFMLLSPPPPPHTHTHKQAFEKDTDWSQHWPHGSLRLTT